MREKTNKDRLEDLKAYKEVEAQNQMMSEYRQLADKALVDPRSFAFYFACQQAEFIVQMHTSIRKAPFKAIETGFDSWLDKVTNPSDLQSYLYVLRKNNKLEVDYYRIRRDFPIK